jgi:diguanylate cyclase (GGDEF)-like protein
MAAILISNPQADYSGLFKNFGEHLLEAGTMGLGMVAATVVLGHPVVLAGVVVALVAMHRALLVNQYQRKARTDTKTGLATASWWHELAEQALARACDRAASLGVLMLDLDHFRSVNEIHGHLGADRVLAAVGDALREETREQDICGRFGGDELAVLIPDVGTERNLRTVAERIRRRIRSVIVELPGTGNDDPDVIEVKDLTISIGGAVFPAADVDEIDDLLRIADERLFAAKRAGRDRTCLSPVPPVSIPEQVNGPDIAAS